MTPLVVSLADVDAEKRLLRPSGRTSVTVVVVCVVSLANVVRCSPLRPSYVRSMADASVISTLDDVLKRDWYVVLFLFVVSVPESLARILFTAVDESVPDTNASRALSSSTRALESVNDFLKASFLLLLPIILLLTRAFASSFWAARSAGVSLFDPILTSLLVELRVVRPARITIPVSPTFLTASGDRNFVGSRCFTAIEGRENFGAGRA
mmetsp:Transcript_58748/g.88641  ORF Transcript_58748/g.88641 Transcript_58748/m.88641 type:complete len:210 (+) Transcript_58748:312-941(+)